MQQKSTPDTGLKELRRNFREKCKILDATTQMVEREQEKVLNAMKKVNEIEKKLVHVPPNERHGSHYESLVQLKTEALSEEKKELENYRKMYNKETSAYSEFDEARQALSVHGRREIETDLGMNTVTRVERYQNKMKRIMLQREDIADFNVWRMKCQEEKAEPILTSTLDTADKIYSKIRDIVKGHKRGYLSGDLTNHLLKHLRNIREIIDQDAIDYVDTKTLALNAFNMARSIEESIHPRFKASFNQEFERMIPKTVTKPPTRAQVIKKAVVSNNVALPPPRKPVVLAPSRYAVSRTKVNRTTKVQPTASRIKSATKVKASSKPPSKTPLPLTSKPPAVVKKVQRNLQNVTKTTKIAQIANSNLVKAQEQLRKSALNKSPRNVIEKDLKNLEIAKEFAVTSGDSQAKAVEAAQEKLEEILQNPKNHSKKIIGLVENASKFVENALEVATNGKQIATVQSL